MKALKWLGLVVVSALAAMLYLADVPKHPPGFYIDEASIAYNAHRIAQDGADEYSIRFPLFFRAFGEYKNPVFVYILAAVFRITGPSMAGARVLAALLGWSTGILLGWLGWRMTRRWLVALMLAVSAWLTPWLFESSRLVLEVSIYPAVLVLFLIAVWLASNKEPWSWKNVAALSITLALVTYSYSIGRLLGPLLALGLAFFITRGRSLRIAQTWLCYAATLIPLVLFSFRYPGALTGRFTDLAYWKNETSLWVGIVEFIRHYLANLSPTRWLFSGENNVRDHVADTGSLLAISVLMGLVGLIAIGRSHRRDPWWRFIVYALCVSVVPASLTRNEFPQLRLIAFPVLWLVATVPALQWLVGWRAGKSRRTAIAYLLYGSIAVMVIVQGLLFQRLYHRNAPSLWYVFDARFPRKVLAPALLTGHRPIYLVDPPGKSGYIQALWHGLLGGVPVTDFVRLPSETASQPGSVVISTAEECNDCVLIARSLNYIVYAVPPCPDLKLTTPGPLPEFHASIVAENPPTHLSPGERVVISLLIKNASRFDWPTLGNAEGAYAVQLHSRWRHPHQQVTLNEGAAKRLPYDIEPGDTFGLSCQMTAPEQPGVYVLEFDLVQEQVGPFADHGAQSLALSVRVGSESR